MGLQKIRGHVAATKHGAGEKILWYDFKLKKNIKLKFWIRKGAKYKNIKYYRNSWHNIQGKYIFWKLSKEEEKRGGELLVLVGPSLLLFKLFI